MLTVLVEPYGRAIRALMCRTLSSSDMYPDTGLPEVTLQLALNAVGLVASVVNAGSMTVFLQCDVLQLRPRFAHSFEALCHYDAVPATAILSASAVLGMSCVCND
jgi:hypothetical protein